LNDDFDPDEPIKPNYDEARARKTVAEADLAEVKVQKELGGLVLAEDVVGEWEKVLSAVKAKMLAIPAKAAPVVSIEENASACQHFIESLVHEALEELSNYEPSVPSFGDGGSTEKPTKPKASPKKQPAKSNASAKAAPKTNRQPVGRRRKKVGRAK